MLTFALDRLEVGVSGACAFLDANNAAREIVSRFRVGLEPSLLEESVGSLAQVAPSATAWRIFDHCAAMSRLYALFEQFCESVLADWIDFRTKDVTFSSLPESIQNAYAIGFPQILSETKKVRFSHLSASSMVAEFNKALEGNVGFRLTSECLTSHRGNIRWEDISGMFDRCGLDNLGSWVSQHSSLIEHFQEKKKIFEQTQSKLAEFVRYRNDAAHALVALDEIMGRDQIIDFADFIKAFCKCLSDFVCHSSMNYLISCGSASNVGIVTQKMNNNITICHMEGGKVKLGDKLYLITSKSFDIRTVEGLMLNDLAVDEAIVALATEVGVKFDLPGIKRAHLIAVYAEDNDGTPTSEAVGDALVMPEA